MASGSIPDWFADEARYERRLVAFFDVLGWKDHINAAGKDTRAIGQLRAVVRLFSAFQKPGIGPISGVPLITSFSDNVIVSTPFDADDLPGFVDAVARSNSAWRVGAFSFEGQSR